MFFTPFNIRETLSPTLVPVNSGLGFASGE